MNPKMDEQHNIPVFKLSARGEQQIRLVLTPGCLVIDTALGYWSVPFPQVRQLRDWLNENVKD